MDLVPGKILIAVKNITHIPLMDRLKRQTRIPRLLEGMVISVLFAASITLGELFLLDIQLHPRMVLQPWLLQRGFLQYTNIPDEHSPLLPQVLSWLQPLFKGNAVRTAKVVFAGLVFLIVCMSLLWLYQRYGRWACLAGGAFFVAYSGLAYWALWYDLALSPVYLLIFFGMTTQAPWIFIRFKWRILALGLAGGLAVLIKQQAILVVAAVMVWVVLLFKDRRLTLRQLAASLGLYSLGVILPVLAYVGYFWHRGGALGDFFYWVFFPLTNNVAASSRLLPTSAQVRQVLPVFFLLIPFVFTIFYRGQKSMDNERSTRIWVLIFLVITAITQYPRYSTMHWASCLAFIAIGSAIVCGDLLRLGEKGSNNLFIQRGIYFGFVLLWLSALLTVYMPRLSRNPPPVQIEYQPLIELSAQLREQNLEGASFVIFPDNESVSNLYYLLNTTPPTYWLMTYPWFMNHLSLSRWEDALDREKPDYVILFSGSLDWCNNLNALAYIQARYQTQKTLQWQGSPVQILSRRTKMTP